MNFRHVILPVLIFVLVMLVYNYTSITVKNNYSVFKHLSKKQKIELKQAVFRYCDIKSTYQTRSVYLKLISLKYPFVLKKGICKYVDIINDSKKKSSSNNITAGPC